VVAETRLAAGSWHIGLALAPNGAQGRYQGVYGAGVPVARTVGPLLLTGVVLGGGAANCAGLGVVFLLAGLTMGLVTGRARMSVDLRRAVA
jgi:hypothetical protein